MNKNNEKNKTLKRKILIPVLTISTLAISLFFKNLHMNKEAL